MEPAWHTAPSRRTEAERDVVRGALEEHERDRVATFMGLRASLIDALRAGKRTVVLELATFDWLAVLDEVLDRPQRNMTQLLRDDAPDRLHDAIDRLHREANILIAGGPRQAIAAAFDEQPPQPIRAPSPPPARARGRYTPTPSIRASSELERRVALDHLGKQPPRTTGDGEITYGPRNREPGEEG